MDIWSIVADVVILLGAAVLMGGIFARFGQSPLVGYLLAGMLLGGGGSLGIIKSANEIDVIAELGVSLLLFSLGLEFSPARLRQVGGKVLLAGAAQVIVTLAICGFGAWLLGSPPPEAAAIGAMVALSSTAIVLRTLKDSGELDSAYGRNALAVLLVQDLAVVPLAMMVTILGGDGESSIVANVTTLIGLSLGLIVGLYLILNVIARHLLGLLTLQHNRELAVLLAVVVGLGAAWASHAIKLSPALGAFVAGMFLGSSPFAHQLRADVSSFRIVLLTIFFGAAGMVASPYWMATHFVQLLFTTTALLSIKGVIIFGLFRALGQHRATAATTSVCLAQVGEFAFVLGTIATASGVLPDETRQLIVSTAILSLLVTPFMLPHATRFGNWVGSLKTDRREGEEQTVVAAGYDVAIFGFGPVGRAAAEALSRDKRAIAVVDLNKRNIDAARACGLSAYLGDATQSDVLDHIALAKVQLFVVTLPDVRSSAALVRALRKENQEAHIIVRARSERDMQELIIAGADEIIGDESSAANNFIQAAHSWLPPASPT